MNPVIKFTTLFGLLAVELAVSLKLNDGVKHTGLTMGLTIAFFLLSAFFVYRSFYGMMIGGAISGPGRTAIAPQVATTPEGHVQR
jgi:K(+)-stimulated pyrophosphate-energized sodium pump